MSSRAFLMVSKTRTPGSLPIMRSIRSYATHKENPNVKSTKPSLFARLKSTSTFAFTTVLVFGSIGVTGLAIYAIGSELFSSSGDTKLFNRSINLIEHNLYCQKLLQSSHGNEKLSAHGDDYNLGNRNGWGNRNRPIASSKRIDKNGNEHHYMRFFVESSKKHGVVNLEAIKEANSKSVKINSLSLTVDNEKFYVVAPPKPNHSQINNLGKNDGFLGLKWGTSK